MAKKILIAVVALLALWLIAATRQPDHFRVERSTTLQAPPAKVFAILNDFHQFGSWSPWEALDPALKTTYSGAPSGPGAVYTWEGNDKVGSGRMEILQSEPDKRVLVKLDFIQPFEGHNTSEYTLEPGPNGTTVTWAMYGPSPLESRLMGVFVSMDRMIGGDFEKGLAQLKAVAEK